MVEGTPHTRRFIKDSGIVAIGKLIAEASMKFSRFSFDVATTPVTRGSPGEWCEAVVDASFQVENSGFAIAGMQLKRRKSLTGSFNALNSVQGLSRPAFSGNSETPH